ncbi:MAG: ribonucleotide reductase N-terminal alpha domain-containing protein [Peptococcaceae bacterium MAG4]|nr:ribonucleotide reductase N-terminal alpha domain-containing protein [Peptococcaceae bacterium MAG4]
MLKLSEAGQKVFDARYAARDENGKVIETFEQAVCRLAKAVASAEKKNQKYWEEKFADIIGNLLFIPSTPIWANVGKPDRPWQPAACFVLSVEDSLESMYETLKHTALVFKSGGGVGYNFSPIRPKGSLVHSTKGRASGVVELIKLYDASSNMVMQGGVRRGASMGILNIDHPEIEDFIKAKLDGELTNFNISVGVTDAFMEALENDKEWPLVFGGKVHKSVQAKELWDMIISAAHACGDPGVLFLDRLQETNPVPGRFINATNPCVTGDTLVATSKGYFKVEELVGCQFEALVNGVPHKTGIDGFFKTGTKPVIKLKTADGCEIRLTAGHLILGESGWVPAGRLKPGDRVVMHDHENGMGNCSTVHSLEDGGLENVYDVQVPGVNAFDGNGFYLHNCGEQPLSPGESCLLGSINLAKMLTEDGSLNRDLLEKTVKLAVRFLDNLIDIAEYPLPMIAEATRATRKIGLGFTGLADALIKAGLPYDSEEGRNFAAGITRLMQEAAHAASRDLAEEKGCFPLWEQSVFFSAEKRRNAACITIAPTGSVTTLAGCEGYGMEPIFAVAYKKATNVAGEFEVFSPLFLEACKKCGVPEEVLLEVARRGTCQNVRGVPEEIARIFKGAQDISPEDHILMQAEVQKYVDNAVSKTINLPSHAAVEDIDRCYRMAYGLNLKGITVFRDGSKKGTVTSLRRKAPAFRHGDIRRAGR